MWHRSGCAAQSRYRRRPEATLGRVPSQTRPTTSLLRQHGPEANQSPGSRRLIPTLRKLPEDLDTNYGEDVPRFLIFSLACSLFANWRAKGSISCAYSNSALRLPDQFERELDLPGGGLCGRNQARAWNRQPILIENRQVLSRRGKIGAVEDVEKFGPELSIEILRNPLHRIILEDREIQIRYSRPN